MADEENDDVAIALMDEMSTWAYRPLLSLEDFRRLVKAVESTGRLLPPGGATRTEYGIALKEDNSHILGVGTGDFGKTNGSHQRQVTSWPGTGPNDYWPKYTTAWVEVEK